MMAMTVEQMNDTVVIAYRVITMFLVAIIKIRKARTTLVIIPEIAPLKNAFSDSIMAQK